jgi:hypothetical protein
MNQAIHELFSQEVTRREFLVKAGLIVLAATGIAGILRNTILPNLPHPTKKSSGFGSGRYGQ